MEATNTEAGPSLPPPSSEVLSWLDALSDPGGPRHMEALRLLETADCAGAGGGGPTGGDGIPAMALWSALTGVVMASTVSTPKRTLAALVLKDRVRRYGGLGGSVGGSGGGGDAVVRIRSLWVRVAVDPTVPSEVRRAVGACISVAPWSGVVSNLLEGCNDNGNGYGNGNGRNLGPPAEDRVVAFETTLLMLLEDHDPEYVLPDVMAHKTVSFLLEHCRRSILVAVAMSGTVESSLSSRNDLGTITALRCLRWLVGRGGLECHQGAGNVPPCHGTIGAYGEGGAMPIYLQVLSDGAGYPHAAVKAEVCRSLSSLLEWSFAFTTTTTTATAMSPYDLWTPRMLESVAEFLYRAMAAMDPTVTTSSVTTDTINDAEEELAVEATEFWAICANLYIREGRRQQRSATETTTDLTNGLASFLVTSYARLLPRLLRNVVHPLQTRVNDKDDEVHEDLEDGDGGRWTLRRSSAATLELLSRCSDVYNNSGGGSGGNVEELFRGVLFPLLRTGMGDSDPWIVEACVLVLGAVVVGHEDDYANDGNTRRRLLLLNDASSMDAVLTGLLSSAIVEHPLAALRATACWTLGRMFSKGNGPNDETNPTMATTATTLIERTLSVSVHDASARVRYAAATATAALVDTLLSTIIQQQQQQQCLHDNSAIPTMTIDAAGLAQSLWEAVTAVLSLSSSTARTATVLLRALGSLIEQSPSLSSTSTALLGNVLELWEGALREAVSAMPDSTTSSTVTNEHLRPMLRPTMEVATAFCRRGPVSLGAEPCFQSLVSRVYGLCVRTVSASEDDADAAVDCLTAVLLLSLTLTPPPPPPQLVLALVRHWNGTVRSSAFAMVGTLARHCPALLADTLPSLWEAVGLRLDDTDRTPHNQNQDHADDTVAVIWATGEMALAYGFRTVGVGRHHAGKVISRIVKILSSWDGCGYGYGYGSMGGRSEEEGDDENDSECVRASTSAVALGRLSLVETRGVAEVMFGGKGGGGSTSDPPRHRLPVLWARALEWANDPDEGADGCRGLAAVVKGSLCAPLDGTFRDALVSLGQTYAHDAVVQGELAELLGIGRGLPSS